MSWPPSDDTISSRNNVYHMAGLNKDGATSVVKRSHPQITVLGARPMSEVGFRDARSLEVTTSPLDNTSDVKLGQGQTAVDPLRPPTRPTRPPSMRLTQQIQDDSSLRRSTSDGIKPSRQRPVSMFASLPLSLPPSPPKRTDKNSNLSRGKENRIVSDAYLSPSDCPRSTGVLRSSVSPPPVDGTDGGAPVPKPRWRPEKVTAVSTGPTIIGKPRQSVLMTSPPAEKPENGVSADTTSSANSHISPPAVKKIGVAVFPVTIIGKPPPSAKSVENTMVDQRSPTADVPELSATKPAVCAKPAVRPKPALKPKPATKPKPTGVAITSTNVNRTDVVQHLPSHTQVDAAIDSTTKTVMAGVQKQTQPAASHALSAAIAKPGSRTSHMIQPVVNMATKHAYAEAERRVQSSVKSTVHSTATNVQSTVGSPPPKAKPRPQALPKVTVTSSGSSSGTDSKWHEADAAIDSTTKTVMAGVQKQTQPAANQALSAAIAKPGSRTSHMIQPVVNMATKHAYAEAERRVQSSVKSTVHSTATDVQRTVVGSPPPKAKPRPQPLPEVTVASGGGSGTESKWHEFSPPSSPPSPAKSPVKCNQSASAKTKKSHKAFGPLSDAKSTLGAVASVVADRVRHRPSSHHADVPKRAFTSYVDLDGEGGAEKSVAEVGGGTRTKRPAPARPPAPAPTVIRPKRLPSTSPPPVPVSMPVVKPTSPSYSSGQGQHCDPYQDYSAHQSDEIFFKPSSPTHVETGPRCRALYDYESFEVDDLCFSQGDTIILLARESDDWLRGTLGAKSGIFPSAFVEIVEDLPSCEEDVCDTGANAAVTSPAFSQSIVPDDWDWERTDVDLPTTVPEVTIKVDDVTLVVEKEAGSKLMDDDGDKQFATTFCIAKHSFSGEGVEELSFDEGDRIAVTSIVDSGWLAGTCGGRHGMFPKAFVDMETPSTETELTVSTDELNISVASANSQNEATEASLASPQASPKKSHTARALFDFSSEVPGDLNFSAGDLIAEVEPVDSDWMTGTANGVRGIFPANFVQSL